MFDISPSSNQNPKINLLNVKAELFAICRTVEIMKNRFEAGLLPEDFYVRRMKTFFEEISQINQTLLRGGKKIDEITHDIPHFTNLTQHIQEIMRIGDLKFDNNANTWNFNPYQIATTTSKVTSNFITLLDYLHLTNEIDPIFLNELYSELGQSLNEISAFKFFAIEIENLKPKIFGYLQEHKNSLPDRSINSALKTIEDVIYRIYNRFKQFLQSISLTDTI